MLNDMVFGRSVGERSDICIVPVRQHADAEGLEKLREEVCRPEDTILARPSLLRMAIQPVNKYNTANSSALGPTKALEKRHKHTQQEQASPESYRSPSSRTPSQWEPWRFRDRDHQ